MNIQRPQTTGALCLEYAAALGKSGLGLLTAAICFAGAFYTGLNVAGAIIGIGQNLAQQRVVEDGLAAAFFSTLCYLAPPVIGTLTTGAIGVGSTILSLNALREVFINAVRDIRGQPRIMPKFQFAKRAP